MLEEFWRPIVVTIGSMTHLQSLRLGVFTTYGCCAALSKLTALTNLDLAVRCSSDFQQPADQQALQQALSAAPPPIQALANASIVARHRVGDRLGRRPHVDTFGPSVPYNRRMALRRSGIPSNPPSPPQRSGGRSMLHAGHLNRHPPSSRAGNAISRVLSCMFRAPTPLGSFLSCLLYTSPSPRDRTRSRMPSSA